MKLRRAWILVLVLGCGPQPPVDTTGEATAATGTSGTTGEGTTTGVTTSTSTGVPTSTTSQTTDDSAGSSGGDTGMEFILPLDFGGSELNCDCPQGQLCVVNQGIDSLFVECAIPPAGCDPMNVCTPECAKACFFPPPGPDDCSQSQRPTVVVKCQPEYGSACSPWAENCPDGEKCVVDPFESRCVPLGPQPIAVGEPCEMMFDTDPCEAGALCRHEVAPQQFVCAPYCLGSPMQPICPDGLACTFDPEMNVALCLPP